MNAVVACLFLNFSMNSLGLSIFLFLVHLAYFAYLLCIPIYTHDHSFPLSPFQFPFCRNFKPFICVLIPTLLLSFCLYWRPGVAYISLFFIHVSLFVSSTSPSLLWVVFAYFTFGTWTQFLSLVPLCPSHIPTMCTKATTSVLDH